MPKRKGTKEAPATPKKDPHQSSGDPADVASKEQCRFHEIFKVEEGARGKIYLTTSSFPSYVEDDIWAILQDCGFDFQNHYFRHQEMGISTIENEEDLRQHLLENGLPPNLEEDPEDEDDPEKVKRWVAFSHVPIRFSDAPKLLSETPLISDYDAMVLLCRLGFNVDGETKHIYRGVYEQYDSVREIRAFVRQADNARLLTFDDNDGFSPRKRARRATRKQDLPISDDELLRLRLWAATSPTPLKVFGQEYVVANLEDEPAPLLELSQPEESETEEMEIESEEEEVQTEPSKKVTMKEETEEKKPPAVKGGGKAKKGPGRPRKNPPRTGTNDKKTGKKNKKSTGKVTNESEANEKKGQVVVENIEDVAADESWTPETTSTVLATAGDASSVPDMPSMTTVAGETDKGNQQTQQAESSSSSTCIIL